MSRIARKALRHPITCLLAAATVCAAAQELCSPGSFSSAVAADSTPPVITYSFGGTPGTTGGSAAMYGQVVRQRSGEHLPAGLECLTPAPMVATGDMRSCSATSAGGTSNITTPAVKIDKAPPTLTKAEVKKGDRFVRAQLGGDGRRRSGWP